MKVVKKSDYCFMAESDGLSVFSNGVILQGKQNYCPLTRSSVKCMGNYLGNPLRQRILKYEDGSLFIGLLTFDKKEETFSFEESFQSQLFMNDKNEFILSDKNGELLIKTEEDADQIIEKLKHYEGDNNSKSAIALRAFIFSLMSNESWYDKLMPVISQFHFKQGESTFPLFIVLKLYMLGMQNIIEVLCKTGFYKTVKEILEEKISLNSLKDMQIPKFGLTFCKNMESLMNVSLFSFAMKTISRYGNDKAKLLFDFLYSFVNLYQGKANPAFINMFDDAFTSIYDNNQNVIKILNYVVKILFKEGGIGETPKCLIDLLISYKDYLQMNSEIGVEFDYYPDELFIRHKDTVTLYNMIIEERQIEREKELCKRMDKSEAEKVIRFESSVQKYKNLAYEGNNYSVIIPTSMEEIIYEGRQLNHCVAGYIHSVRDGLTKILFVRENDNLTKPFMTIEVKGSILYQAKKFDNVLPTGDEIVFLNEWANAKNIMVGGF